MAKHSEKRRRGKTQPRQSGDAPEETRVSEALTVGWTVSVTTVLMCDVAAAAAHVFFRTYPDARGVGILCELLLFAGAAIGVASLLMIPVVMRLRKTPPPTGLIAFALCAAAAPILAIVLKQLQ